MTNVSRRNSAALLLSCFVVAWVLTPLGHLVWHRLDHVHEGASARGLHGLQPHDDQDHHRSQPYNGPSGTHSTAAPAPRDPGRDSGSDPDADHGRGSVSHLALAILWAPPPPSVPAPADALTAQRERGYESLRGVLISPRSPRAPPA